MGSTFEQIGEWGRTSVTVKLFAVGVLILVLLIPTAMINTLVRERRERRDDAVTEISSSWAGAQNVRGPILSVPFRKTVRTNNGTTEVVNDIAHFVPSELQIDGASETEIRRRGIYRASVYTSSLTLTGAFAAPSLEGLGADAILWDKAFVSIGLSDLRGVKGVLAISWDGRKIPMEPGAERFKTSAISEPAPPPPPMSRMSRSYRAEPAAAQAVADAASMAADVRLSADMSGPIRFEVPLQLRGSGSLWFIPVGRKTSVEITSGWKDPSFKGAFLPDQRNIGEKGFDASWTVQHMNRNFPDRWTGKGPDLGAAAFGVDFIFPVDHYSNALRSTKYAILFIFLTFLVFFFIEFFNKKRMHPIQYLLVGGGLTVFYLLLLSLSEHMPFTPAYVIATLAVVGLIGSYAQGVFERPKVTITVTSTLLLLYGFLYTLLQMEDYALLIGSIGLFAALAAVMYLTRKIDWYQA